MKHIYLEKVERDLMIINSPYNYVPKPKLERIANLDSWEQVLVVSNNTIGKDITNSQLGKKRGDEQIHKWG